jgi:hypothetical protein
MVGVYPPIPSRPPAFRSRPGKGGGVSSCVFLSLAACVCLRPVVLGHFCAGAQCVAVCVSRGVCLVRAILACCRGLRGDRKCAGFLFRMILNSHYGLKVQRSQAVRAHIPESPRKCGKWAEIDCVKLCRVFLLRATREKVCKCVGVREAFTCSLCLFLSVSYLMS